MQSISPELKKFIDLYFVSVKNYEIIIDKFIYLCYNIIENEGKKLGGRL